MTPGMPRGRRRVVVTYALLIAIAVTTVLPFVWMALTALHPRDAQPPTMRTLFTPGAWHFENYAYVLTFPELPIWRFAVNSAVVVVGVVATQLAMCALAAFAFARLQFRGRDTVFVAFLLTMMVPSQVLIVPLFELTRTLGWLDTYAGLILPYPYLSTAFGTFLLRQYFLTIPRTLDEAARLDGCGDFGTFWHIILPAARPALATVAAFAFIWTWTDFYWPMLATSSTHMRTLEVGLSIFRDAYGGTRWPLQMAAAVIVLAPVVAFFLLMQRYFIRSTVLSGLKG
jgi:multiple sugar transport system permease protein